MKRFISLSLSLIILLTSVLGASVSAFAYEDADFKCGENINAHYDSANSVLIISGTGSMFDYTTSQRPDWTAADKYRIESVVIKEGITHVGNSAFENMFTITKADLPEGLISIGDRAFYSCIGIASITIPASVVSIGTDALTMTNNTQYGKLSKIEVASGNKSYCIADGILYSINKTELVQIPSLYNNGKTLVIPDTVKVICSRSCQKLKYVTEIIVPSSVKEIQNHAFNAAQKLERVTIYSTDVSIDAQAFNATSSALIIAGYKGSSVESFVIEKELNFEPLHEHSYKVTTTVAKKATQSENGKMITKKVCSCGDISSESNTVIPKVSSITIQKTTFGNNWYYTGKAITPTVTVKDSTGKTLVKGTDYTLSYSSGRVKAGRYNVVVKLTGKYSGTKTLTFDIVPRATKITSITPKSKGFTVWWNKNTTQSTGYQIQFSTASDMRNAKTITVAKKNNYGKFVSGRLANKKYYVRIRVYTKVNYNGKSVNVYSPWSATKAVTTKR